MTLGFPAIMLLLFLSSLSAQSIPKPTVPLQIFIDPGHGGKVHGAIGVNGQQEKHIALQVALRLHQQIKKELHLSAHLTRNTDVFLELKDRIRIANQAGADLFISIHCNSSPNGPMQVRAKGIETYFLSMEATGKQAYLVAARENAEAPSYSTSDDALSLILTDLVQTQAHHESSSKENIELSLRFWSALPLCEGTIIL
jgi:N-acetylmuramoyl-L-alanine amidase